MNLIGYDGQIELEEDDWADKHDSDEEEDKWGCEFGEHCLVPAYDHMRSECYTAEMAEEWMRGVAEGYLLAGRGGITFTKRRPQRR